MEPYRLEKHVWNDTDFAMLGWHDATIWAVTTNTHNFEMMFDLDYIFRWVKPGEGEVHYKFWVSPVTMVFKNVHSVKISIESGQGALEIADLHRGDPRPTPSGDLSERHYRVECQEGEITLWATGFEIFVRRAPTLQPSQSLAFGDRGGINFDRC